MKRVLIVDDEENIGRSLRLILEREGYAVSTCGSVGEAKAFSQRPDLYLIDVRLPDGSGIDLVRWLRSNDVARADADDLRSRNHRRSGGGNPRRRFRFSGEAAEPRKSAAVAEARAGAFQAARRKPAAAGNGRRGRA